MSEQDKVSVENLTEVSKSAAPGGAGAMLRAAREAQGLHIAMLAVSLKVPVNKLEALEADRHDLLLDTVFVRALASSMCRALKIDAAPVLAALPPSHAPKIKADTEGLNTTFEDAAGGYGPALLSYLRQPLGITIILLVVGILAVSFLPLTTSSENVTPVLTEEKPSEAPVVSGAADDNPQSGVNALSSVPLTLSDTVSAEAPTGSASQMQPPVPSSQAAPIASSSAAMPVTEGGGVLAMRALGNSWVEVVDAKGVVQLRKTLMKDEVITVSGALPLAVVLGRADLVSVTVRGQALNAVSLANDNVARFEVK